MNHISRHGILKLSGSIETHLIKNVQEAFWGEIENTFQISKQNPSTWPKNSLTTWSNRLNGMNPIMQKLKDRGILTPLEERLQSIINLNLGHSQHSPIEMWYSLLSFPGDRQYGDVPDSYWHVDEPIVAGQKWPQKYFVFVFLDSVSLNEGPTMAISGSAAFAKKHLHELGRYDENTNKAFNLNCNGLKKVLPPLDVFKKLQSRSHWLSDLSTPTDPPSRIKKFMENSNEEGLKVIPLTGGPGDIIIMDPRTLHSYSANVSNRPREVLRLDFHGHKGS